MEAARPSATGDLEQGPHFVEEAADGEPLAWEQVAEGRFMPRRIRGSCKGRALG